MELIQYYENDIFKVIINFGHQVQIEEINQIKYFINQKIDNDQKAIFIYINKSIELLTQN